MMMTWDSEPGRRTSSSATVSCTSSAETWRYHMCQNRPVAVAKSANLLKQAEQDERRGGGGRGRALTSRMWVREGVNFEAGPRDASMLFTKSDSSGCTLLHTKPPLRLPARVASVLNINLNCRRPRYDTKIIAAPQSHRRYERACAPAYGFVYRPEVCDSLISYAAGFLRLYLQRISSLLGKWVTQQTMDVQHLAI